MLGTKIKDPAAVKPYTISWTAFLGGDSGDSGDTIESSVWSVPAGLTITNQSHTETASQVWISGGTAGQKYEVANRITTAAGITDERTFLLIVQQQ